MKFPPDSGESSGGNTKLPPLPEVSLSGELSGFSFNPLEERIAESEYLGALAPSADIAARQRAGLTKEETAAVKAGLQRHFCSSADPFCGQHGGAPS